MTTSLKILLPFILALVFACSNENQIAEVTPREDAVKAQATILLDILRAERWDELVAYVHLDSNTKNRMGIPENATDEIVQTKVANWFQALYEVVKPGEIFDVQISSDDPNFAWVTYMQGDLDVLDMQFNGERWLYVLK